MNSTNTRISSPSYQIFMFILCLYALGALGAQAAIRLQPETRNILHYVDHAVCGLFFTDFLISIAGALFGTFSGFLAAWFLGSDGRGADSKVDALRSEMAALRELLEHR